VLFMKNKPLEFSWTSKSGWKYGLLSISRSKSASEIMCYCLREGLEFRLVCNGLLKLSGSRSICTSLPGYSNSLDDSSDSSWCELVSFGELKTYMRSLGGSNAN
jgi:hypothetical protein